MSLEDLLKRADEAGFTPGPWFLINAECVGGPIDPGWEAAGCGVAHCGMRARTQEEAAANARLIAAAPDMFEALKPFALMADWLPKDGRVARIRISDDIDFEITGKDLHRAKEALLRALISQKEGVE